MNGACLQNNAATHKQDQHASCLPNTGILSFRRNLARIKKVMILISIFMIPLSSATLFANTGDPKPNTVAPETKENKLSEQEINRLKKRVEEIRDMDKSKLTTAQKHELKHELKMIKKSFKRDTAVIYIGGSTLLIIILLLILL